MELSLVVLLATDDFVVKAFVLLVGFDTFVVPKVVVEVCVFPAIVFWLLVIAFSLPVISFMWTVDDWLFVDKSILVVIDVDEGLVDDESRVDLSIGVVVVEDIFLGDSVCDVEVLIVEGVFSTLDVENILTDVVADGVVVDVLGRDVVVVLLLVVLADKVEVVVDFIVEEESFVFWVVVEVDFNVVLAIR